MSGGTGTGAGAALWALVGVAGLFASAVFRLGGRGIDTVLAGLTSFEWAALTALTLFMVYTEGILAFQRKWVPKLIERARAVRRERLWLQLLAPLYGMALVGGPPQRRVRAWLGTLAIVAMTAALVRSAASLAAAATAVAAALFAREWPYSLGMFGAVIGGIAVAMLVESVQRRGRAALRSR